MCLYEHEISANGPTILTIHWVNHLMVTGTKKRVVRFLKCEWEQQLKQCTRGDAWKWDGIEIDLNEVHQRVALNVDIPTMYQGSVLKCVCMIMKLVQMV
jgi:hypothetical protein